MSRDLEVVVDEFRGHPIFTIRKDDVPKFRFGRTKAEALVANWDRVSAFAESGNGNKTYKGYGVLQLDLENERYFRFGQWKASLCVRFEKDIRAFVAQFRPSNWKQNDDDSQTEHFQTQPASTKNTSDEVADKCVLLALHVAFADQRVLEIEVSEIRQRLKEHLRQDSQQQLNELLRNVRGGKANLEEVVDDLNEQLDSGEKKLLLEQLFEIAAADGLFHDKEKEVLTVVHERFGTSKDHFRRFVRLCSIVPYSDSTQDAEGSDNGQRRASTSDTHGKKRTKTRDSDKSRNSEKGEALNRLRDLLEPQGSL
jgi:uncharacterized tellurite resistance protein B-like protein